MGTAVASTDVWAEATCGHRGSNGRQQHNETQTDGHIQTDTDTSIQIPRRTMCTCSAHLRMFAASMEHSRLPVVVSTSVCARDKWFAQW
eukprot:m.301902 g.301902  ORF g.301902 m.301902 type:complete len:89 (-) comp20143_c0_seq27:144-410(-)